MAFVAEQCLEAARDFVAEEEGVFVAEDFVSKRAWGELDWERRESWRSKRRGERARDREVQQWKREREERKDRALVNRR